ncbi:MAG: DUF4215 domain-containing protein [Nannocystales bacterium]
MKHDEREHGRTSIAVDAVRVSELARDVVTPQSRTGLGPTAAFFAAVAGMGCGGSDPSTDAGSFGAATADASSGSTTGEPETAGTDTSAQTMTGTSTQTMTGADETSTGDAESGEGSETSGSVAFCGDGVVQDPEQCDDANAVAADGCESDCSFSPQALVWEHYLDAGLTESARDLALSAADELYMVGVSYDGGPAIESLLWNLQPEDGALLWTESFTADTGPADAAQSVDARAGEVAISGAVEVDGTRYESVRQYSSTGDLQWSGLTPEPDLLITYLAMHPPGDVFTASRALGASPSSRIRRTTEPGTVLWSAANAAVFNDIAVNVDGDVFVVGMLGGEGWIGRFNADGELQWDQTWAGAGDETRLYALAIGPDGDPRTTGPVLRDGDTDVSVQRWASGNGSLLMAQQHDIAGSGLPYAIDVGPSGKTVVCGTHNPEAEESVNAWSAEIDGRGAISWERDLGASACRRVEVDSAGFMYLAGTGSGDAWVAKMAP